LRVIIGEPIETLDDAGDQAVAAKLTEQLRVAVESLV
jgi:hypothetical protein